MSIERITAQQKRQGLKDWVQNILANDFGETFVYHQIAKTQMLHLNTRLQLLDVAQNSNDEIRHCEVFWDGPADEAAGIEDLSGLFRQDASQVGSIQAYRIVIHYGVSYDGTGNIDNRDTFESLFESHEPKGLLVAARETRSIDVNVNGNTRTALLSTPTNPVFPPVPRSLKSGSEEYAHYGEFRVLLTDM